MVNLGKCSSVSEDGTSMKLSRTQEEMSFSEDGNTSWQGCGSATNSLLIKSVDDGNQSDPEIDIYPADEPAIDGM